MGLYHESDSFMQQTQDQVTGRILAQWFDKESVGGPTKRVAENFQEDPPTLDCLSMADDCVKTLLLE